MLCVGISHKVATVDVREMYSYSPEEARKLGSLWIKCGWVQGILLLSTCNRTEFYLTGLTVELPVILCGILQSKNIQSHNLDIFCNWYVYYDQEAIGHLIAVAAGMDSMVLGEDDILHQVKIAYENTLLWNHSNQELNVIVQGVFRWVKRIKTETMLSKTPVSVATLVSHLIDEKYHKMDLGITILLVGASGNMGSLVRKSLTKHNKYKMITTIRQNSEIGCIPSSGREYPSDSNRLWEESDWVNFDHRYEYLPMVDVVISATKSPTYIFQRSELKGICKSILWVDLGVPTDIDPEIGYLLGMDRYDIDYFEHVAKKNNEIKSCALKDAQMLCYRGMEEISNYLCKKRRYILSDSYIQCN